MRKEVLYAILAGSLLGLVIAFGIWRANSAFNDGSKNPIASSTPTPFSKFGLSIAKPENEIVSVDNKITISGLTNPEANLVISAEEKDYFPTIAKDGTFEKEIDLIGGVNQILISSFDTTGRSIDEKLTIIYSSEFSKNIKTPSPSATPIGQSTSSEGSEIRQKVQEKVEEVLLNPKAYLGTVTDINEQTLQIKTDSGEIKQVFVTSEATIIKTGKTSKEVKLTDIAIGDYIVAMGFKNGNNVLQSQRILITSPLGPITRKIILGSITKLTKNNLVLVSQNEENTITFTADTIIYQIKNANLVKIKTTDLETDNRIIVVGENKEKSFEARTILLLP
jgi:hypothetical protein